MTIGEHADVLDTDTVGDGHENSLPSLRDAKRRRAIQLYPWIWIASLAMTNPLGSRSEEQFLQHLAGVHDAERIEHRLDAAHQLDRDLVLDIGEFVALEHADAVFGRD